MNKKLNDSAPRCQVWANFCFALLPHSTVPTPASQSPRGIICKSRESFHRARNSADTHRLHQTPSLPHSPPSTSSGSWVNKPAVIMFQNPKNLNITLERKPFLLVKTKQKTTLKSNNGWRPCRRRGSWGSPPPPHCCGVRPCSSLGSPSSPRSCGTRYC